MEQDRILDCETKELRVYKQGKTIVDQFYVDQDYNVPDAKSDVLRVILNEGTLQVEEMKLVENYIRVSGKIQFRLLYVTDDSQKRLALLEGRFPFEELIYAEKLPEGTLFLKSSQTELTVTVIHSRKLGVKALVELQVCSEMQKEELLTCDVTGKVAEDVPGRSGTDDGTAHELCKKTRKEMLLKMHTMKRDTYRIKEEITVGGTKESIGNLLWTEVSSRKLDTRMGEEVLLLQGELQVFCFYESPEGRLDWTEQTVPYEGQIPCYGGHDDMYHQLYPTLTDIVMEPRMDEDGEARILGVEATLDMRLVVYAEEETEILEDVYALDGECDITYQDHGCEKLLMQNHSKCKVTEKLTLPEIREDILQICHSTARVEVESTKIAAKGIEVEGVLHVQFLYIKANDEIPFDVWQGMIPFTCFLESNETCKDMQADLTWCVEQLHIGLLGNAEIEVRAVLAFYSFLKENETIHCPETITWRPLNPEKMEKQPGMIGYIVKEGDTVWEIARRYGTTQERILEMSMDEKKGLKPGDKILIFRESLSIL